MADSTEPLEELAKLPGLLASVANALPETSLLLLQASRDRLRPAFGVGDSLILRTATFHYRLFIVKTKKGFAFSFKRLKKLDFTKESSAVLLNTEIDLTFAPTTEAPQPFELQPKTFDYRWLPPPFLLPAPDDDTISLNLDDGVLTVTRPDKKPKNATIRYRRNGETPSITLKQEVRRTLGVKRKLWRAEPFFALHRVLRAWMAGDTTGEQEVAFDVPFRGHVLLTLRHIMDTYCQTVNALNKRQADWPSTERARLAPRYEIVGYQAGVRLRLNKKGTLANSDKDDPFQMRMQTQITRDATRMIARITIEPPDFLIAGALYDAFLNAFEHDEEARTILKKKLNEDLKHIGVQIDLKELLAFFHRKPTDGSIFRINRKGDVDRNLFVFPYTLAGQASFLVFSADVKIQMDQDPTVTFVNKNAINSMYLPAANGSEEAKVEEDAVGYFLRLISHIKHWADILDT